MTNQVSNHNISSISKLFLLLSSILLAISIFIPIWRIELDAPQYPEGLCLKIYAKGLGGNVDIINGLNHYIGMKTLHNEDFIEFTLLPYLIGFFALASLITMITKSKKSLYVVLLSFILFGVIAMIDFWKWEYNYGHNLDPNAAIIVPGMAYQPPLIGFKQLLNFGAYSIPDIGGWLFITSGLLMLIAAMKEGILKWILRKNKPVMGILFITILPFISCSNNGPENIKLNTDNCDYCKMTISNIAFACEIVTDKGRVYKFDDLACMLNYKKENSDTHHFNFYISDFLSPNHLITSDSLFYIKGEDINSPMSGNIAAFNNSDSASIYLTKLNATPIQWNELNQ